MILGKPDYVPTSTNVKKLKRMEKFELSLKKETDNNDSSVTLIGSTSITDTEGSNQAHLILNQNYL